MSTAVSEVPAVPPLVAITATARMVEGVERVRLNSAYVRALESAGLIPIVVPPLATAGAAVRGDHGAGALSIWRSVKISVATGSGPGSSPASRKKFRTAIRAAKRSTPPSIAI